MSEEDKKSVEKVEKPAVTEEKSDDSIQLSKNAQKILDLVKELPVIELSNLVKAMEEEFGVCAAAPVAMIGGDIAAAGGNAGAPEEKSIFNIELTSAGSTKINVIKVVRELTGLGLKEAKDIVDGAPKIIKEGVKKEEAESMKGKLEEAGATVELK